MSANHVSYWDYDREAPLTCPHCGWQGRGAGHEGHFEELLDVHCPQCDRMLLIVTFPSIEGTRAPAAAGNERARAELPAVDARESFLLRAQELELVERSQLPDLEGDTLVIEWDFEERDDGRWTVLRHDGREVWREPAYFEGYRRFEEVFELLVERYGSRLVEVRPTSASALYLYGDKLTAPVAVERLNASLRGK